MDSDKDQKEEDITQSDQPENLSDLTENDVPTVNVDKDTSLKVEEQTKSNKKLFVWGIVITGVIVAVVVGFFLSQRKNISQPNETSQPTATPAASPTATPKPSFNRSEWSLEVLNGSGVTGAAKKVGDKLAELGYKVLKTGNADNQDYSKTSLFVSKDLKDKAERLIEDVKDVIKIASSGGQLKDSTASARIIIGKDHTP